MKNASSFFELYIHFIRSTTRNFYSQNNSQRPKTRKGTFRLAKRFLLTETVLKIKGDRMIKLKTFRKKCSARHTFAEKRPKLQLISLSLYLSLSVTTYVRIVVLGGVISNRFGRGVETPSFAPCFFFDVFPNVFPNVFPCFRFN